MKKTNPLISIVVPAYNEEESLTKFTEVLNQTMDELPVDWELIVVDDGSRDNTWELVTHLAKTGEKIRGIRLSRNFGHQYALLAGLEAAKGDAVVMMDSDLQHPPFIISELIEHWERGTEIVNTERIDGERTPFIKKFTSRLYYKLFSKLSGIRIVPGSADFRLLDRRVVNDLLKFQEEGVFLRGIVQWVGYSTASVKFICGERFAGESKYHLRKMVLLAWHGVSSFSLVPLRIAIFIGLISSTLSFFGVAYAIVGKMIGGNVVPGWTSVLAFMSIFFGMLFFFLALLAEYIGRILIEVRNRPRYLIRETLN